MRSNSKHTAKELEKYIQLYIHEGISYKILCKEYGLLLGRRNFNDKVVRYQDHGLDGIQSSTTNNHYSKEFKHAVVMQHLEEGATIGGLARKYNIPSNSTVRNWILKYTQGKDFRVYSEKPEV